jgi:glycosyltransferase involved in cell wall biosynthesis
MDTDEIKAMVSHDIWNVAVLIPARDEENLLPRCLESIATARAMLPPGVTSDVIVISDSSTDRTVDLARAMLGTDGVVLETEAGCVGVARALAATVALHRHTGPPSRCWLANTDADCEVPATWLVDQLRIARKGYAAVTGVVDVHDFSEHFPIVEKRFRRNYQIRADGTHSHVHGANLGVRADRYLLVGGWGPLATGEDHDLWRRLDADDGLQLSDAKLRVITSGRRVGRAPLGFAGALAALGDAVAA